MKQTIAITLAALIMAALFSGCTDPAAPVASSASQASDAAAENSAVPTPPDESATAPRPEVTATAAQTPTTSSPEASPEVTPEPSVFPISYTSYGNNYSFTGYAVKEAEDGTTEVTLFGMGYNVLPFRNGSMRIPAWCSFESGGETHEPTFCSTSSDALTFTYETSVIPETLIVTSDETEETILSFDVNDEPQRES